MNSFCLYCWILRSFSEHFLYRTPLEVFLFHVQVSGFQSAYTITISQVLFKHFVWDRKIASRRCSFNQSHWKLSMKKLIRSEVARCQSPCFWKKTLLCILPSFSQNIYYQYYHYFFRKGFGIVRAIFSSGKQKVVLLTFYLFNYDSYKFSSHLGDSLFLFPFFLYAESKMKALK